MGKYLFLLIFIGLNENAQSADTTVSKEPMKCLMSRAMVTGASISSGLDGISFADQLTEKYGTQKKLIHEAYPGVAGEEIITYPSFSKQIKKASMVMALDFFYWDQFSCEESDWETRVTKTIDTLFEKTVKNGIPLMVGKLSRGRVPFDKIRYETNCAETINQKVKLACDQNPKKCIIVNHQEMAKFVEQHFAPMVAKLNASDKRTYVNEHITRDGTHPRTDSYAVMAQYLDQFLQASKLECK